MRIGNRPGLSSRFYRGCRPHTVLVTCAHTAYTLLQYFITRMKDWNYGFQIDRSFIGCGRYHNYAHHTLTFKLEAENLLYVRTCISSTVLRLLLSGIVPFSVVSSTSCLDRHSADFTDDATRHYRSILHFTLRSGHHHTHMD